MGGGIPNQGDGFDDFGKQKVTGREGELGGPTLVAKNGISLSGFGARDGGVDEAAGVEFLEVVRGNVGLEPTARHGGGEQSDAIFISDMLREITADTPIEPVVAHGFQRVATAHQALDRLTEDFD